MTVASAFEYVLNKCWSRESASGASCYCYLVSISAEDVDTLDKANSDSANDPGWVQGVVVDANHLAWDGREAAKFVAAYVKALSLDVNAPISKYSLGEVPLPDWLYYT